jgi:hypothetical protein
MILEHPPATPPRDVTARPVQTVEEMAEAVAIQCDVFDVSETEREAQNRGVAERFRLEQEHDFTKTFLAWVGGKPAASGLAVFAPEGVLLAGGCTRAWARGRGAYRALVAGRWEAAVGRGTPTLVIQASSMSEPIVRRLGFVELFRIQQLVDIPDEDGT